MQEFIARHHEEVAGTLSGFDRVVFRGTLRRIAYLEGMQHYLRANDVLLKDFGDHVNGVTEQVKKGVAGWRAENWATDPVPALAAGEQRRSGVYRTTEGDPDGQKRWRRLRRGIADFHRRAELSRKGAERYLDAFAAVDNDKTLDEVIARSRKHAIWCGKRVRALRPFDQDQPLLAAVARGEFTLTGFRNRDLQSFFFSTPANSPKEARRRSAWTTRQLRLLRAHGLITKIQGTHRYLLTDTGRRVVTAVLAALHATIRQLTPLAA